MSSDDPAAIRSVAVTREDVVTALESNLRSPGRTVLRVTPPFSGRMRARLHEAGTGEFVGGEPLHLDPEDLVEPVPTYPDPATTEDELRAADDVEYTTERHRERHVEAVEEWRAAVRSSVVDTVELGAEGNGEEVTVKALG
ncbi:hypothetical protein [Halostella litorea]|uniref:hypothetical protein n=1 Tax=Halostella litorea TaxID=2528831 RepID=UPI001092580A|nr:hypothetical protein [Halostella litorea]